MECLNTLYQITPIQSRLFVCSDLVLSAVAKVPVLPDVTQLLLGILALLLQLRQLAQQLFPFRLPPGPPPGPALRPAQLLQGAQTRGLQIDKLVVTRNWSAFYMLFVLLTATVTISAILVR